VSKPFSAKSIANYFLLKKPIDPMKLQKLVYYAHGWHLAFTGRPLINETVEAWEFGPVVADLYHEFKHFGTAPITDLADDDWEAIKVPVPRDETVRELLDWIWKEYGKYSGVTLSNMTHKPGTPWEKTVRDCRAKNNGALRRGVDIPDDVIREHFIGIKETLSSRGLQ
jgi:uncharacterized phage-associated protein